MKQHTLLLLFSLQQRCNNKIFKNVITNRIELETQIHKLAICILFGIV